VGYAAIEGRGTFIELHRSTKRIYRGYDSVRDRVRNKTGKNSLVFQVTARVDGTILLCRKMDGGLRGGT